MKVYEKGVLENSEIYFHTPSNIAKSLFFYLISAGHFYCNNKYFVKRDHYNSYLLIYVKSGEGKIFFDNKTFQAKSNDAVLIDCYNPHTYTTDKSWEIYWIHFDGNLSKGYFELLYNRYGCVYPLKDSIIIPKYISEIINEFRKSKFINEPLISSHIYRMLAELLIISSENYLNSQSKNYEKTNQIQQAINFIKSKYKEKLTVELIAKHVCMSPFHFSRVFKKETGYSPYEYLTMIRLNKAKILLKSTDMSIKEIANEVGFNNESNFVISFKKHTKMTPTQFRKISF
ncbi:MAG TPA: AraC family transcriptional regulator [Thermoanaerobacter sp.]|nr:AraC family transcriptional regulator [Thermoanaerobacter sp.]